MSATRTRVTIETTQVGGQTLLLDVFTPYATALVEWFQQGKERTHTVRGVFAFAPLTDEGHPIDVTLSRDHVAYIITQPTP